MTALAPTIEIAPFAEDDLPVVFYWLEQCWNLVSDDSWPKTVEAFIYLHQGGDLIDLAVHLDGEFVGMLTAKPVSPWLAVGHCVFRPSVWGTSVAFEAVKRGIEFLWSLGYFKVACHVYPENERMIKLLSRLGAHYEGVLISETRKDGMMVDMLSFCILRGRL